MRILLTGGLLALVSVAMFHCKQNDGAKVAAANEPATVRADPQPDASFMAFYEKFHQDSAYQMAHIAWPLEGASLEQRDSTRGVSKKMWQPAEWRMHRLHLLQNANEYERSWELLGDLLVTERLRWKEANFYMIRRFAKQSDGEWSLIYYADVLEMKPIQ